MVLDNALWVDYKRIEWGLAEIVRERMRNTFREAPQPELFKNLLRLEWSWYVRMN